MSLLEWCQHHITPRFPQFRFQSVDAFACAHHNPEGKLKATECTFPYPANTFDVALASSVFTHMLPDGVENYVAETARVLKRSSRFLVSHLLLNGDALRAIEEGTTIFDLRYESGPCRILTPRHQKRG